MVKTHPVLYIPKAYVGVNNAGYFYGTGVYAKPAQAVEDAVAYVLANVSKDVVFKNPNISASGLEQYNTIYYADGEGYDPSIQNLLKVYPERPLLLFVDFDNTSLAGVLAGSEVTFDNIVDMFRLFQTADYNYDAGIYELKKGDKVIPFVFDPENAHLILEENGELVPKHSLLDLIYVGANLGFLDRPYLRDWFNKVLRGYKDELIDLGILALAAAGAGTALISKNKKYKIGGAGVAAVSGSVFGYRVYSRQKKQKEASK